MKTISPSRPFHSLEILESRIAPASLTFIDVDGETITVETSKGAAGDLAAAIKLTANGMGFRFDELDLRAAVFAGTTVSVTAETGGLGDDKVNLGLLNALGRDLGVVTIDGRLGQVNAGDAKSSTAAIKSLTVQGFGDGTALDSDVVGAITTFTVDGDFNGAFLRVRGSDSNNPDPTKVKTDAQGKIGTLTINGSLLGTARDDGGHIEATGAIGAITVTGSIKGFIDPMVGGMPADNQQFSGRIFSGGKITSLTVGNEEVPGSITGGDGEKSGQVVSADSIGTVRIFGNVVGGAGLESGAVGAGINLKTVSVTGNLMGGFGERSGTLLSVGSITTATIGGNIEGGMGRNSGAIGTAKSIGTVVVTGDVIGGDGPSSGQIVSQGTIQNVTVTNLIGGSDFETGSIGSLKGLGTILVKGNIVAGAGTRSGIIATEEQPTIINPIAAPPTANAPIGSVTVMGSIFGDGNPGDPDVGNRAGSIISSGQLGPVVVGGSVFGGDGTQSGAITSSKGITSVKIDGGLNGGGGGQSGSIYAIGAIGSIAIGIDKVSGARDLIGGDGSGSGSIASFGKVSKIEVFGSVLGGDGPNSGRIEASELGTVFAAGSVLGSFGSTSANYSGTIYSFGKTANITIGDPADTTSESGSLVGGIALGSGSIYSGGDLGTVKVKRDVVGGAGDNSGQIFSQGKIASINIGTATTVGSLIGGSGNHFSSTEAGSASGQIYAAGTIGTINITGSVQGTGSSFIAPPSPGPVAGGIFNNGDYAGLIRGKTINTVIIAGGLSGGSGIQSGGILADQNLGTVTVSNVSGGSGGSSGFIAAQGNIKSVKIKGSLAGGSNSTSAFVAAGDTLSSFEAGYLSGGVSASRPRVSAGKTITSVDIGFSISDADILAGYTIDGVATNPDATIGKVVVGAGAPTSNGTSIAFVFGANIVAGISAGSNGTFGNFDDVPIVSTVSTAALSRIASVIVHGSFVDGGVLGSYGIVAQHVVSIKTANGNPLLTAGALNDRYAPLTAKMSYGELPELG